MIICIRARITSNENIATILQIRLASGRRMAALLAEFRHRVLYEPNSYNPIRSS